MNLKNSKLNLEGRFNYPIRWEEGQLNVETAKLGQFKTMPFKINFVIHPNGINNKLEGMLSIPAFGSAVALSNLEIYIPFSPSNEFYEEYSLPGISFPATIRTSVSAGPFDLPLLQKKLCVLDTKPLKGNVSIHYKDVYNRFGAFELKGDGKGEILGGNFNLENLSYHFDRDNPLLDVNLSLTDLDLQEIGKYTNLGDMRGSLDIELKDASYALTSIGPIPLAYDFTVKGRKRSEKTISFYGRAVDNILEMLGSRKADMPWIARTVINIGMSFRNWFPATADYMGFHAKTSSGWTELRTFDPVLNSLDEKIESHYLLYGTAFKVPLNSHGVYPVMMKTEAFQRWLWGMIDYFKKISAQNADSKDILKTEEECYPFWKYDYETL